MKLNLKNIKSYLELQKFFPIYFLYSAALALLIGLVVTYLAIDNSQWALRLFYILKAVKSGIQCILQETRRIFTVDLNCFQFKIF